ncbi:putative chromosome-partitioning protein ParB [BD1-7 clade bacterium]|uniref:Probable chromosome-partitioning protein ParB n=1 Tax=BD1-7 clade bacterium TaxID=2029982 RepID=A0A5S9QGU8_9GAMM|nr:putative chromosome-partitioning protein ParB [BD1-7 clade bacterium]
MAAKKRGLGRGLDALLSANSTLAEAHKDVDTSDQTPDSASSGNLASGHSDLRNIPIEYLQRGKYQPRKDMSQPALEELAASIKAQGLMQPIVVRPLGTKKFEIIAGERRWRASQLAGLDTVPVIVRDVADDAAIAMALIENIQREDLNPIEEAMALHRLQSEFELTQQQVADAVGKSRSAVTNLLRLMSLRDDVRRMLEHGDLEMGHARALLALPKEQQSAAASTVVGKGLSVRQTESLVRKLLQDAEEVVEKTEPDADIRHLEQELSEKLGSPVAVQHSAKGKGRLVIKYSSLDELDGVLSHLRR